MNKNHNTVSNKKMQRQAMKQLNKLQAIVVNSRNANKFDGINPATEMAGREC